MRDIMNLARIQLLIIVLFVIGKWSRPSVLEAEGLDWLKTFLLSFPNLCEGIIGVLVLTGLGVYLTRFREVNMNLVYAAAVGLATMYVVLQELKIHNLGGNNIYDPNDLIFSCIGLFIGGLLVFRLRPQFRTEERS